MSIRGALEIRRSRKRVNKYNARKVEFQGITFDSKDEWEFYMLLKHDKLVKNIELQPQYTIIEPFKVECSRCGGNGRSFNQKTGNYNQCLLCKGRGVRTKTGAKYTADFKVTYIDGHEKVIDVKGGKATKTEAFMLRKKLFEKQTGRELTLATKTKNGWEVK